MTATGEFDAATAPLLADTLHHILAGGSNHVVIDLTAVDFFDAAALGVIAAAHRASVHLDVICPRPHQRKLFAITNLDRAMTVHLGLDTAMGNQHRPTAPILQKTRLATWGASPMPPTAANRRSGHWRFGSIHIDTVNEPGSSTATPS